METSFGISSQIYESETTCIYRGYRSSDYAPVIIKSLKQPYPKPADVAMLKYERTIAAGLALPGVVKTYGVEKIGNHLALVMEDFDGVSLDQYIGASKLSLKQLLTVGISIADTLGAVHLRGVIHRDIKPHNIIVNVEAMEVKLTDFGLATSGSHGLQSTGHLGSIAGTLAYMSPEQTGRMNRVIDCRSDLYSLGVTLYELSTGVLPFQTADSLEMVYSHIVRIPTPPRDVLPEIPAILSDIIIKLLAKLPEDRYQNAYGLKADLQECLRQLESTASISRFPLGVHDFVSELRIPHKVYGREPELSTLLATWNRARQGPIELLLVSGYSGIGKTVLVNDLHKSIVQSRGYFIAGKFDLLNRSIPYAAVAYAFRELIRIILTEADTKFAQWQSELQSALGASGAVMTDVIPELELLIGAQLSVPPLPPIEAQNRFNLVFHKFCRTLATAEHPLVLFLDDLQWADPASLKFIQGLLTQADMRYLLVIGAYRDNEVDANHLFSLTVAELRKAGAAVNEITLKPLGLPVVNQIVADTLSSTPERTAELSEIVFAKTRGNPFFMHQLIKKLHSEELLWLDSRARAWTWDLARIGELQVLENVVHFVMDQLRRLAEGTQRVLKHAAAIGHKFDLGTLSLINGTTPRETLQHLGAVLREGFIWALDANSRFLSMSMEEEEIDAGIASTGAFKFSHDRVQQAAYSLIPAEHRQELHLRIGRQLLTSCAPDQIENRMFGILGHMNQGTDLIIDLDERRRLAELNLRAGRRAKVGLAYESARNYCRFGSSQLALESRWEDCYELCFALQTLLAECELLTSNFTEAERLLDISLARAKTTLDKVDVHSLRMRLYQTLGKFNDCISAALSGLALLGIEIPAGDEQRKALLKAELAEISVNMKGRKPAELYAIPVALDLERRIAHKLLADAAPPAFGIGFTLGAIAVVKQLNSSIKYGHSDTSAFGYILYSRLLMGGMGRHEDAYEFAKLGIALNEKFNNVRITCSLLFTFASTLHYFEPLREALKWLSRARHAGLESGEFRSLSHSCQTTITIRLNLGDELDSVREENERLFGLMQRLQETTIIPVLTFARQIIKNLKGETTHRLSLSDPGFDEPAQAAKVDGQELAHIACWYHGFKLQLAYLYGDYNAALAHLDVAEKKSTSIWATSYFATEIDFFACLTMAAAYKTASAAQQEQYRLAINGQLAKLTKWALLCPSNYDHKYKLVMAELARISGEELRAMALYDEAIESARKNEFLRDEAIANELAARFYLSMGRIKCARSYLVDAYQGYLRWGAAAKAEDLAAKIPGILAEPLELAMTRKNREPRTAKEAISSSTILSTSILDVETVIRSAQALAGEVVLENVVTHLLNITMKNVGAQKGVLILEREGSLVVEASVTVDPPVARVGLDLPLEKCTDLPLTVVQYVARTKSHVIIGDVTRELRFAADPYLVAHRPGSILCLAMALQGRTTGIFYLENTVSHEAFTSARVELLKLLLVQAATSIENSRLYTRLQSRTEALSNAEVQLRREFEERERSEQARAKLQEEIIGMQADRLAELSTPLIPITDRIMVMPLIGIMDAERAQQVLYTSLQGAQTNKAKVVIIDITGIKLVDSGVATALINTANALRLLGAQAVITGIRAEVARKFVELQIDFAVVTKSTLQSGIAYALQRTGSDT